MIDLEPNLFVQKNSKEPMIDKEKIYSLILGIGFTILIACIGVGLSKIPKLGYIGPFACAILFSVLYRQIFGYPEHIRIGIQFSSKYFLRFAIVLYGLKLNMNVIFHQGFMIMIKSMITVLFSFIVLMMIAKLIKADMNLSLLLSIGTGICGAAAIAAISPIMKAKEEDTAMGIGIIALVGTIFSIIYPLLLPFLHLNSAEYGTWAGLSLHEIANVALAAAPAGENALAFALLSKLSRVFLLIPVSFLFIFWMNKKGIKKDTEVKFTFPWFLIGFILMSFLGSFFLGEIMETKELKNPLDFLTSFLLTMAMTGLGLNINVKELQTKAFRPFIAILITSLFLSIFTFICL
ncbi:putative sulfate exporter family transporter [Bacillus sp. JJ664]